VAFEATLAPRERHAECIGMSLEMGAVLFPDVRRSPVQLIERATL
jgi:hypothetical protein